MLVPDRERDENWLAFGLILRFLTTAEGGRSRPLGVPGGRYEMYQYRPDWVLAGMGSAVAAGAPVLALGTFPVALGQTTRAVIVPLAPVSMQHWDRLRPGDELGMIEGPRTCGHGLVEWVRPTTRPLPDDDVERFAFWARGGSPPR